MEFNLSYTKIDEQVFYNIAYSMGTKLVLPLANSPLYDGPYYLSRM